MIAPSFWHQQAVAVNSIPKPFFSLRLLKNFLNLHEFILRFSIKILSYTLISRILQLQNTRTGDVTNKITRGLKILTDNILMRYFYTQTLLKT